MSKTSGKQQILTAIGQLGGIATSAEICERVTLHNASVDKILKGLVETGELKREKGNANGKQVFHYSIPAPTHTSAEDDDDIDDDDDEYYAYDDLDDDDEDEDYDPGNEDAETDISYGPANAVMTSANNPGLVFLIRKDDIPGFSYGPGGHKFAREISQFVKHSSRRFERFGHAVVSIFISETPTQLITAHMQAALPEITFTTTYSVTDAIEAIQRYSDEIGRAFYVENFRIFVRNYHQMYEDYLPSSRENTLLVKVGEFEPEAPKTTIPAQPLQPAEQTGDVIERLAQNGMEYLNFSPTQLGQVFQKLAQFYIENNW